MALLLPRIRGKSIVATVFVTWGVVLLRQHKAIQNIKPKDLSLSVFDLSSENQNKFAAADRKEVKELLLNAWPAASQDRVDGYFNNIPVSHQSAVKVSSVHCAEDPRQSVDSRWMTRSCQFNHLCFDLEEKEYVVIQGENGRPLQNRTLSVAIGGINPRYDVMQNTSWKLKWFPNIITSASLMADGYYQLPENVVLVPFHSLAAHNPGHLLWDDFFPIYSLLRMFGFTKNYQDYQILPIRHQLTDALYATCDKRRPNRLACASNLAKFAPLLGVDPATLSPSRRVNFTLLSSTSSGEDNVKSRYVCARHGIAGIGVLTDHGFRDHGWTSVQSREMTGVVPHNLGRGGIFRDFSQFLVNNLLGHQPEIQDNESDKIRIVFSLESSKDADRRLDFAHQLSYLHKHMDDDSSVLIQAVRLWEMTSREQVELARKTDIFVSACGGGSMTATFLPDQASFLVFYNVTGSYDFQAAELARAKGLSPRDIMRASLSHDAARLDWDLLNNAAHLRVHWLPVGSMDDEDDLELLLRLIQHEVAAKRGW